MYSHLINILCSRKTTPSRTVFLALVFLVVLIVASLTHTINAHNPNAPVTLVCIILMCCIAGYAVLRWDILINSTISHCMLGFGTEVHAIMLNAMVAFGILNHRMLI